MEGDAAGYSKCTMFSLDNDGESVAVVDEMTKRNVTDCLYGWEFDTSTIYSSIIIDVNTFLKILLYK